jgi:UDP-GlcNAc:undecaprenyl-phosphate/decaprenyl-phosphate GlcNAc-1-phosphate transferase
MGFWMIISCALVGMGIVFLLIPPALSVARARGLLQRGRDPHHTHHEPVPRLGGLALAIAFIGVELFITVAFPEQRVKTPDRLAVLLSSLVMFGLGFWDDLKPLGAKRKLLGQISIALTVCAFGIVIQKFKIPFTSTTLDLGGWGIFLTVLWLVGMTNLINLIDGVDGLAGGICLMLTGLLAYVGHDSGGFECLVAGMAGALIGFLWFNFPPARVYLGDSGAYFLGYQIGLFALINSHKGTVLVAMVAPMFVLALPILDTSLAILRRGLRGLPIFRADKSHLHHHLLEMGLSRRRVVFYFYGVTLLFLAMAFVAYWSRGNLIPVLLGTATLVLLLCAGRLHFSRSWFAVGRVVSDSLQMREEVQYTLTLMRWLELEGGRHNTAEELWSDLVFAVQRLGYTSIKLSLADGERVWTGTNGCLRTHTVVASLEGGRLGSLELEAPACETGAVTLPGTQPCEGSFCPCVADERVFEIVSELLAEGWIKAARKLENGDKALLRFDTRRASPIRPFRRRFSIFSPRPARVTQASRKPADSLGSSAR